MLVEIDFCVSQNGDSQPMSHAHCLNSLQTPFPLQVHGASYLDIVAQWLDAHLVTVKCDSSVVLTVVWDSLSSIIVCGVVCGVVVVFGVVGCVTNFVVIDWHM